LASRIKILLRIVFGVAFLGGVALAILFLTPWPMEYLRSRILQQVSSLTGAEASIGSMEIRFFPPRVILRDIRLERRDPAGEELRVACREADLSLPYGVYLWRLDRIDSVALDSPDIFLHRGAQATAGSPTTPQADAAPLIPVSLGRVSVTGGKLRIEDPASGREVALAGVDIRASPISFKPDSLQGRMERGLLSVRMGEHQVEGNLSGDFMVAGRTAGLTHVEIDSPGNFKVTGSAKLDLSDPIARMQLAARGTLSPAKQPRPLLADLNGNLEIEAKGEMDEAGLRLQGGFKSQEMHFAGVTASRITGQAEFRYGLLQLKGVQGEALGGAVTGDGTLAWGEEGTQESDLSVGASLENGSAREILKLLDLQEIPISGRVSHRGDYHLSNMDLDTLEAEGEVSLRGTLQEPHSEPLQATSRFHLKGKLLELTGARATTPTLQAAFQGTVPLESSGTGGGRLIASTRDLSHLQRFLNAIPPSGRGPLSEIIAESQDADLELEGDLTWRQGVIGLDGQVRSGPLTLRGVKLGEMHADLQADPRSLDLRKLSLSGGEVPLDVEGAWRDSGEFRLAGEVGNLPVDWLKEWIAQDWPVEGRLTATLDLKGHLDRPEGSVDFRVDEPRLASIPLNLAEGRIVLGEDVVTVESFKAIRDAGEITVVGSLGLRGKPIQLDAEGKNVDLKWLHDAGLVPEEVAGPIALKAQLRGTLEAPLLEAEATTPSVTLRGFETGAVKATFSADRTEGALVVVPEFKGMNFAGRILWDERYSFDGDLILEQFQVPVTRLGAELPVTDFDTVLTGGIRVEGALRGPAEFDAYGNLVKVTVRLGQVTLESQVPAFFRWEAPRMEITPLRLAGSGTDLTLKGVADPFQGTYHFSADGTVGLATLASFYPGLIAGGFGIVSVAFDATPEGNHLQGWASVHDGRLQGAGLPLPITSLQGRVVLDAPGDFHLEGVQFIAGGGAMSVEGKGKLKGIQIAALNLQMQGSNVQIAYPEGFRGRYDMDLGLALDEYGGRLSGAVGLIRGVYSKDFNIERSLFSLVRQEDLVLEEEPEEESLLSSVKLDLSLRANDGLWIINDLAKLEGRANLHIGGTVAYPQITGRVSAFEGSVIRFRQVDYQVDHGNIDLVDLDKFNPYFDIAGQARVQDYDIFLKIDGSLEHIEFELTSNPPLSQQDIVALLVSGRTLESLGTSTGGQQTLEESATSALTGGLASGLQGVAKLDQFSIDPVILGHEGDPASRVTVGKQISENLYAAYSTLLGGSSEEIYEVGYKIGRDFKLTSTRDADGGVGGDLRYVWRRKTGPGRPKPRKIRFLTVEGDPGISPKKLHRLFRLEPGDAMDRGRVTIGEDRLLDYYRSKDRLQAQVEARQVEVEGDPELVDLVLKVDPGPEVIIQVEGTKSDRKYRKKLRNLWQESVFPEELPEEAKGKLEQLLRQEGYYHAKVVLSLPVDTSQEREVILKAEPGARVSISSIEIAGNQDLSTEVLLDAIHSKAGKHKYLNPEEAKVDSGRIRAKYYFGGFPDAKVPPPQITLNSDGTQASLRFDVTEGAPVRLRSVEVEGNVSLDSEELLEELPVMSGSLYVRAKVKSGADQIRLAYDRAGFVGTKVTYELTGPLGADLVYKVEEGTRRYVGDIRMEGNLLTRTEVMERELTFKPGDPLSRDEILKSQRALYRLGVFRSVEFIETEGTDPDHPGILIRVAEADNLIQSVGVGYDSQEGIRGIYDITNTNLFGRGRTLSLILRGSQIDSRAQVLFKDPYIFNRRMDSLVTLYWLHQENPSFTEETIGTTLQVSKKHTKKDRTFYRYTLKDVDVSDLQVSPAEAGIQNLRLSGPSFSYTHDSRDDFFNPRKGNFDSLDVSLFPESLGSDLDFVKLYGLGTWFKRVGDWGVWAQALRVGLEIPYGDTTEIPISERYFTGGDTTVRGFDRDEVGPKDPVTGNPLGGQTLIVINQELRYPIWRVLSGVVFVDAGNVTSTLPEFFPLRLRWASGLGIRIDTPIGPFRLEYGWKLNREPGESPGEWNFSIGQAF
jgi:outer membrane protein assembly complex protein YaeT